jgi:hypothetical protein
MAQPDIVKGTYIDILIGDGANTEAFVPICGLTTRQFTQQVNTNDVFVPDCADPEDVPVRRLVPTGKQWDLSGDGLYNLAQEEAIREALGVTKNYRFRIARPTGSTTGAGYYEGPAMLTNTQIGGNTGGGEFGSVSLTIASDGAWEWVPAGGGG